jgi:hypothetical protein
MSGGIARGRLAEERKAWRKNHPHVHIVFSFLFLNSVFSSPFLSFLFRFWFGMRILPASGVSPPWLNDGCFSITALFLFLFFSFLRGFLCVKVNEESQRNKLNFASSLLCA